MADFATTSIARGSVVGSFGGHPGHLHAKLTLSSQTYANGNLNLSSLTGLPATIAQSISRCLTVLFTIANSAAAYMVIYTPATTPTLANMGTLKLFTATGAEASGSLTLDIYVHVPIPPPTSLW